MMEWALAILFGAAILLLILSFLKTMRTSSKVEATYGSAIIFF